MPHDIDTLVPTAVGDLGAIIRVPDTDRRLPGVVLVDGSGDGDRHDWGGWPEWIGDAGSVVLRHDKPGCGGSPGDWTEQTLEDRARESLAAVTVLREHPATAGQPIGLYGVSQGGWVALLAAAVEPAAVDFVVCHSGPGTTPAEQERDRLENWLRAEGHEGQVLGDAMAWVDERVVRIRQGDSVESVLAERLPPVPQGHGFAVFPGADHGLFVADPDPSVARRDQLAPSYLPTLTAFLADRARGVAHPVGTAAAG